MISDKHFKKRLSIVGKKMIERGIDVAIVFNNLNIYYLTGFPRGRALILRPDSDPVLVVPELEFDEADETFKLGKTIAMKADLSFSDIICSILNEFPKKNVALERQYITIELYSTLSKRLEIPEFTDFSQCVLQVRSIKDPEEIELIRRALRITENSIKYALEKIHEDMSEIELAGEIEYAMRKYGAEGYAFNTIVASGPRSAYPHGSTTDRRIKSGDLIVIDVGAKYYGYCSDITRTIVFDSVNESTKKIFDVIIEAMDAAISKISTKVTGAEVDEIARKVIEKYGYGKYFTHSLGHGVGLAVHEEPGLNSRNNSLLSVGNVVTIEPGIYIRGFGGVRLEDMVVVREDRCEILNSLDRILF
ncbi:MAG: Xaa-Pro peptidase family protein [Candidatus Methanomethylicia archaeon]